MEKVYLVTSYEEPTGYEEEGLVITLGVFSSYSKAVEAGKVAFETLGEFAVSEYELDEQLCSEVVKYYKDEEEGWYSSGEGDFSLLQ